MTGHKDASSVLKERPNLSALSWDWCLALYFPNDSGTRRHGQTWYYAKCCSCYLHQMLFQYWRNYNNWFWLPVKRVDVKLRASICYFSENFTSCDVWRRFKAVRQRMTSCTRLQGRVCIILLLFLLQQSGSLKAFRKRKTFHFKYYLEELLLTVTCMCTWNWSFAVTIFSPVKQWICFFEFYFYFNC